MKKTYKNCLIASILTALLIVIVSGILYINNNLPNTIFVNSNQTTKYNFAIPEKIIYIQEKREIIMENTNCLVCLR